MESAAETAQIIRRQSIGAQGSAGGFPARPALVLVVVLEKTSTSTVVSIKQPYFAGAVRTLAITRAICNAVCAASVPRLCFAPRQRTLACFTFSKTNTP